MRKKILLFGVIALMLGMVLAPFAASAAFDSNENHFVPKDKVITQNYFKAGNNIDIAGTLEKDAYVAGQIINIDGVVKGDVFAAGNILRINGTVEGSVRFAGQTMIVNGEVKRNVMMAGTNLSIAKDAMVDWEVLFAGNMLELDGVVGGDVRAAGAMMRVNGELAGDIFAEVDTIEFLDGAKVNGGVFYKSNREVSVSEKASIVGLVERSEVKAPGADKQSDSDVKKSLAGLFAGLMAFSFLSLLLIAIVVIALAPKRVNEVAEEVKKNFWRNFGIGLLFIIVTPIACILAMFTVIGIPLALIVLVTYFIVLFIAKIFFAIGFMKLVFKWFKKRKEWHLMLLALIGLFLLILIKAIPVIGWAVGLIATATGFGALMAVKKDIMMK